MSKKNEELDEVAVVLSHASGWLRADVWTGGSVTGTGFHPNAAEAIREALTNADLLDLFKEATQ